MAEGREQEMRRLLQEIWDSVPADYAGELVQRHAQALNRIPAFLKQNEQLGVERLVSQDNPASRKAFEVQYCNLFAKYPFDDEDKKMLWDMWSEGVVWGQDNPYSD